jgi:hypothetical protein
VKTSNDVFFFTLVDFLAQVLFLGLVLFAIHTAAQRRKDAEIPHGKEQLRKLLDAAGVSNLGEVTDLVTRMAPIQQQAGSADFIRQAGGIEKLRREHELVFSVGGIELLKRNLEKLKKYDDAYGMRPCMIAENGKPQPVATLELHDDFVEFRELTPELRRLLRKLKLSYAEIQHLELADFRTQFQKLSIAYPGCWQYVSIVQATQLIEPAESVQAVGFHTYGYSKKAD